MSAQEKLVVFAHALGLSSFSAPLLLMLIALHDILRHGVFVATEPNLLVLVVELSLALYSCAYLAYLCLAFIKKFLSNSDNKTNEVRTDGKSN